MEKTLNRLLKRARLEFARGAALLKRVGLPIPPRSLVVYHPGYISEIRDTSARHTFDVLRAKRILEQLMKTGVFSSKFLLTPDAVTDEELMLVHTPEFLDEIRSVSFLTKLFAIQPQLLLTGEDLLKPFLLQAGGTRLALERAIQDRLTVFNLGGGFHHAERDRTGGFCPINDVAIAIRSAQQKELARRILVIDLDYHHGNGTALIFSDDESVFTLSIHGQAWAKIESKHNHMDIELPSGTEDGLYLKTVHRALKDALIQFRPHAAIYLAGADTHKADDMGDFELSEDGLLDRDLFVWQTLRDADIPLAVVLAGGYGPMAWTIAYNFIFSVITGVRIDPKYRPSNIEAKFRRVAASLTSSELKQGDHELTAAELNNICHYKTNALFMGYYTQEGFRYGLERYGLLALLREKGFENLIVSTHTDNPQRQIMRIHFDHADEAHLLIELVVHFANLVTPKEAMAEGIDEVFRLLCIDWLLMQNPRAEFSLDRQKLPGQKFPGLGIGRWMLELLRMMAERLDCTGLMNIPEHYHNAYIYSKQMLFFHPEDQGTLEAMKRDLAQVPLVEASLSIDEGRLRDAQSGAHVPWEGKPQVMPVEENLNAYFARPTYIQAVAEARDRLRFRLS